MRPWDPQFSLSPLTHHSMDHIALPSITPMVTATSSTPAPTQGMSLASPCSTLPLAPKEHLANTMKIHPALVPGWPTLAGEAPSPALKASAPHPFLFRPHPPGTTFRGPHLKALLLLCCTHCPLTSLGLPLSSQASPSTATTVPWPCVFLSSSTSLCKPLQAPQGHHKSLASPQRAEEALALASLSSHSRYCCASTSIPYALLCGSLKPSQAPPPPPWPPPSLSCLCDAHQHHSGAQGTDPVLWPCPPLLCPSVTMT